MRTKDALASFDEAVFVANLVADFDYVAGDAVFEDFERLVLQ